MEEKKAYGLVMVFVGVFVFLLVSIMSYSLWRDRQVNAFMTTNRAWGIQCDTVSQAAWVIRDGKRVDLQINHLPLYCSGYRLKPVMMQERYSASSINTVSISICHASRINS